MFRLVHPSHRLFFVLLTVFFSATLWTVALAQDNTTSDVQTCVPAQPDSWVAYMIQAGDSLSDIAVRSGSTIQALQGANCLTNPRWIVAGTRLFVPRELTPDPYRYFLGRCLEEDFTSAQCRRMFNAYNGEDDGFAERCLAAGFTTEECRRIQNMLQEEAHLQERCRNAGLSVEECRRLVNANTDDGNGPTERCRNAGYTTEECRRLMNANQNGAQNGDTDRVQDRDRDQSNDQQGQQNGSSNRGNGRS